MSGQIGFATESTPGTGVTPTKFVYADSARIRHNDNPIIPSGVVAGRFLDPPAQLGFKEPEGTIEMQLPTLNIETLLKHMIGSVVTTGTNPYTHTYAWATAKNLALTIQTGEQDSSDTVQPFTAVGCKFTGWTLSTKARELATLSLPFVAMDSSNGTSLASATYQSSAEYFAFDGCVVTQAGTPIASANETTLQCARNLRERRPVLGSRTGLQALNEGKYKVTGTVKADFDGLTFDNLGRALTQTALVYTWTRGSNTLTITCNVQFDTPEHGFSTNGLESEDISFTMVRSTPAAADSTAMTAVLVNTASSAA